MGVYEAQRYPFLREEIAAIGEAVRSGMPTVGVCLGSQLLAAALGAAVKPNPAGKEVGWGSDRKTPAAVQILSCDRFERRRRFFTGTVTSSICPKVPCLSRIRP
jgi:GMP synthase (glutamine-hydrolysing)